MNRPCPDCTKKGHPGFRDPRHSDAFCRTCEGEGEIDPIQSMRDQGIADACAGRAARFRLSEGLLFECNLMGEWLIPTDSADYREAFAYARAYEAEKGAE